MTKADLKTRMLIIIFPLINVKSKFLNFLRFITVFFVCIDLKNSSFKSGLTIE